MASSGIVVAAPVNGSSPPAAVLGADEDAPPTAEVVVVSWLVEVAPDVVVMPEVLVAPDVVVVGAGAQPVTQKTLCLTSAPWEPSALMVNLTWTLWLGWGSMPLRSRVEVALASRPAWLPPPRSSSSGRRA